MKITIDGKEVLQLTEIQEKIIKYEIESEIFDGDMTRRCKYWLERPQNHYAHINKALLTSQVIENGAITIPSNNLRLAEIHADEFPGKYGYEDLISDIPCTVGDDSFSFSVSHQKIFRKMKESEQDRRSLEDYLSYEKEEFEKRIVWILPHRWKRCLNRLKLSWMPKLEKRGIMDVPIDDELFAELVFSQSDYKDRDARDLEEAEKEGR